MRSANGLAGVREAWRDDEWVRPFFVRYGRVLTLAVILGVVSFVFAGGLMFTSGYMISLAATLPFTVLAVHVPSLYVRIFGIGKPALQYFERLQSHDWALRMTSELRRKLYEVFERSSRRAESVGMRRMGDVLGLLAEDVEHVQNLYLRTVFPLVVAWVVYAVAVIVLGVFSLPAALALALLLGIMVFVLPAVSVCVNGARLQRAKAVKARLYAELTDDVMGVADWVFSGRGEQYVERHRVLQAEARAIDEDVERFSRVREVLAQVVFGLAAAVVLMWAAFAFGGADGAGLAGSAAVQALGQVTPENAVLHASNWVAAFALCIFPLAEAFSPASEAAMGLVTYGDSIKRMNSYSGVNRAATTDIAAGDNVAFPNAFEACVASAPSLAPASGSLLAPASGSESVPASALSLAPSSGSESVPAVSFEDVSFAYAAASDRKVLDRMTLSIPQGQRVAVLGRSGAGKSTLAALVRGNLVPSEGTVRVCEREASAWGDAISRVVGVIQQKPHLFNWTLRDNVRLGRMDATDAELVEALQRVGLGDLLERLPQGLNTMVDEAGRRFSGGERHRIALARVLLANTPIVILDEPFAGLDPATEQALIDTIFDVLADRTVIMITHHLQGVAACDRVLFVENGGLVMDGSPDQLERESDRYRRLLAFDRGVAA